MSKEEIRSKMKEKGVLPQAQWMERPLFISSTGDIFEPYVPPEGDGKVSFITKEVRPCGTIDSLLYFKSVISKLTLIL